MAGRTGPIPSQRVRHDAGVAAASAMPHRTLRGGRPSWESSNNPFTESISLPAQFGISFPYPAITPAESTGNINGCDGGGRCRLDTLGPRQLKP